jgi:carbonic anhydrase
MFDETRDRADFLRAAGAATLAGVLFGRGAVALGGTAADPHPKAALSPAQALARLTAGNRRFVAGKLRGGNGIAERRAHVAPKQAPFAMVLTCADSRVAPELVFDQSVGDLFVCRVAGNVTEPTIVGSFEYASAHFASSVLVVMGHQRCGAVNDTVALLEAGKRAPAQIQSIVDAIGPAVRGTARGSLSHDDYVEAVIRANARRTAAAMRRQSPILAAAVRKGTLKIVAARYSLDSGKVTFLT